VNQENVLTDEELVGLAVDGDEMAEETLIRRYREFVLDRAALFSPGRRAAHHQPLLQRVSAGRIPHENRHHYHQGRKNVFDNGIMDSTHKEHFRNMVGNRMMASLKSV
jgi:hypothetical protein